jgi:lysophospholipase L1-like esterase
MARRRTVLVVKVLLVTVTIAVASLIAGFLLEVHYKKDAQKWTAKFPRWLHLYYAYQPFHIEYINPTYLFFFAYDKQLRRSDNSRIVSVDDNGFRGQGPEFAGGKKLAFLVGGSTAFGMGSSSNDTTITGFLNHLQGEYFFVNAGVPSWITTQELHRLAAQILPYKPSLIIDLNGINDIASQVEYREKGVAYEPGTPESFDSLYALVGDIRSDEPRRRHHAWYRRWYPTLSERWFGPETTVEPLPLPDALRRQIADRYLMNMRLMDAMSKGMGSRFIGVFQPFTRFIKPQWDTFIGATHRLIVDGTHELEFHDFGDLLARRFGGKLPPVVVNDEVDLDDQTIFIDGVHLTDRGAKIVAEELWKVVSAPPSPPP